MSDKERLGPRPDQDAGDVSGQTVHVTEAGARDVFAHKASVTRGTLRDVKADEMVVRQGGAQNVEATNVTIRQGGALQVKAENVEIVQGGVALAQTDQLKLSGGSRTGGILAKTATIDSSMAQAVIAGGAVQMEQAAAVAVIAPEIKLTNSAVGLLIARHVEGDVNPMFGPQAAVAFGAAFGAVFGLVFGIMRALRRK